MTNKNISLKLFMFDCYLLVSTLVHYQEKTFFVSYIIIKPSYATKN